jgi:aerobic-type carbon monoxide dehydrogenase small subunit (CoxS/CutS family)
MKIRVTINGALCEREAPENINLLHFLREYAGLTGTKEGCGGGECGACTVLLDGRAVNSCLVLAAEVDGKTVRTIEGEAHDGKLSELQQAFAKRHAVQCGFCTPGVVMSARALIERNPKPSVEEIKEGLEGNFCRCTGYVQIIEAVLEATGQQASTQERSHA